MGVVCTLFPVFSETHEWLLLLVMIWPHRKRQGIKNRDVDVRGNGKTKHSVMRFPHPAPCYSTLFSAYCMLIRFDWIWFNFPIENTLSCYPYTCVNVLEKTRADAVEFLRLREIHMATGRLLDMTYCDGLLSQRFM